MGRFQEFEIDSRETEDEILKIIKDICEEAYQRRKLEDEEVDAIIIESENRIGRIIRGFRSYVNGDNYVTLDDMSKYGLVATNKIIEDLIAENNRGRSRDGRGRDRDNYRDRDRDRGRGTSRMRFSSDDRSSRRSSGFALAGGSVRDDDPPPKSRSQIASEASQRQRQEEKEIGQGKVNGNTSTPKAVPAPKLPRNLPKGTEFTDNFAMVGKLGDECPINVSTLDIPSSISKVYNNLQHNGILVDNAITVDHQEVQLNVAFGNVFNAVNFLKENDSTLFIPDDYCHVVNFPKVTLALIPGLGESLFEASAEIKKFLYDLQKDTDMIERLSGIASILNQVNPKVRSAIMNRVLRRWNVVARSIFCIPENPNEYLEASTWEHLLRFCAPTSSTSIDPTIVKIRERLDYFVDKKGKQFSMKLFGVMEDVLADLYLGNNGFLDIRKEHLEYIIGWDELPICIDQRFRPRDILSMDEDQRKSLAAQFMSNYCCMVEDMSVIITNLNVIDMTIHPSNNHIVATDIPTVRVLQLLMEKSTHPHLLYTTSTGGNNLAYVAHCGISMDNGVQLVTLKDSY